MTLAHRATVALLTAALAVSVAAADAPSRGAAAKPGSPAGHGATWLSGQLTDGVIVGGYLADPHDPSSWTLSDDYGLTIDTALALKSIGGHTTEMRTARKALAANVDSYITGDASGDPNSTYAGATAKSLVLAQQTGADPTTFGGVNLVKTLNGLVSKGGPTKGRIVDVSKYRDYANTLGQILAVRGLTAAKSSQRTPTRTFLLEQQCKAGYFRLDFAKPKAAKQSCGPKSPADPDTTSYAVVQLWKTSKDLPKLRAALKRAVVWLDGQQRKNGSFVGGTSTSTPNTNSTGLAAWALGLAGQCKAARAAATWVSDFQLGAQKPGSPLAGQRGAIAYNGAGLEAGERNGITHATQDQWRRAAAQAAPGLLYRQGC